MPTKTQKSTVTKKTSAKGKGASQKEVRAKAQDDAKQSAPSEASPDTVVNETAHSINPTQAQAPLTTPGEILGQVSWLMAHSPMHKHMFFGDLEWLIMPALLLKQFRVFRKDGGPIAFASWAYLDEAVGERMAAGNIKLALTEWNIGEQAWLIDLVAPFGGHETVLKELKEQAFADRSLKSLQAAPDGSGIAVVEW